MNNLRQAAQRALKAMEDGEDRADMIEFSDALIALRAALAEPECKCTMRQKLVGDGCAVCNPEMAKDLAEPEHEPFMVVSSECAERGCMAHDDRVDGSGVVLHLREKQEPQTTHWEGCEAVHPECKEKNT